MAKLKYHIYHCKDCNTEYYTQKGSYCPSCGDDLYVDYQRTVWLERAVTYKRPWTTDDDMHLIESVQRGIKNGTIAKDLDRTKDGVAERLRRLRKHMEIKRGVKQ